MKIDAVQRWLQAHCERLDEVAGGVIVSQSLIGNFQTVAEWPAEGNGKGQGPLAASLATVAQEAVRRGKSLVLVPAVVQKDAEHARAIAVPLLFEARVVGAVALAVRSPDPAVAKRLTEDLERVSASLAASVTEGAAGAPAEDSGKLLQIQQMVADADTLPVAALKLANHLASAYSFDRVSVGLITRGTLRVVAVSHGENVDERQDLVRGLAAVMEEVSDQQAAVQYPVGLQESPRIVQAHAHLAARTGTTFYTVPLMSGGSAGMAKGAISFERKGATPLTGSEREICERVAAMAAPVLKLKRQAERTWWQRAVDGVRAAWQQRGVRGRRIALVCAVLAALLLFFLPVTFHVGAPARVEGAMQRVLAAPMDGFLRQTKVRPGDTVKKGDVLVELADQELLLEKRKWESEVVRHQNNFSLAMGRSDRGQFAINYARAAEAKAQLDLIEQQLARAHVIAPMDALVIQGDLTQIIGAPVKRGDTLLTLAPKDQYRVIVEVDERDIAHVRLGQRGRLALAALPGETLHLSIQRITPVATITRDGRNVFDVEAKLDEGSALPRHGLQGVAKIESDRHSLAWIGARRIIDWLRLSIWSWMP